MTAQPKMPVDNSIPSIPNPDDAMSDTAIGYLVPEFPGQTHVMFWREVQALRQMGERVALLSTRRPSLASPHHFTADAIAETHYLFPPSVSALSRWIGSGSSGVSRAIEYIKGLEAAGVRNRVRQCALLASAVELKSWAHHRSVKHMHAHSCADAAHVLALARQIGGPPYSLTLHGDLDVYGTDHISKMRDAAFVQVVGRHLRHQVEQRVSLPKLRIIETFMGIETSEAQDIHAMRTYQRGSLDLITVARLQFNKGHNHALTAIAEGKRKGLDLHYTIVGDGPDRASLVQLVDDLGLKECVTFTGARSSADVHDLLLRSNVFILPSTGHGEAWPVSVMEAMSSGLPVIATEIGATPEMIKPGQDGFLVPQADSEAISEKLKLLAHDTDLRRRIGSAARETASRRFDVKASAGLLRDAIRDSLVR